MMSTKKSIDGLTTKSQHKKSSNMPAIKKASRRTTFSKKKILIDDFSMEVTPDISTTVTDITDITTTENTATDTHETIADSYPTEAVEDFLSPVQAFDFDEETGELKESQEVKEMKKPKPEETKKSKQKTKKKTKKRHTVAIVVLIVVLIIAGFAIWAIFWGNDIIAKITGGKGNVLDLLTFVEEKYDPLQTDANGRTNILAIGTSGYNMDGDEGDGTHDGAQLTDSIMLISLNQETGDIAMLSFPRDLKVSRTCTATGKVNEIYWCNNMNGDNEEAGATALMDEIGEILGIDIQYYAHLNWGSLVQIVDLLGGINVTLDEGIYDYYYTGAVFDPGVTYTIDGEQALGLSRARHGTMGGDFTRGASQQKILVGIKDRVLEKSLSLSDLLGLASTLGDNLRTNFSVSDLKTLAHIALSFDFDNMRQLSLYDPENGIYLMTTGTINDISYVLPAAGAGNYHAIQEYTAKMLSSDPRVYEEPTILVLNGTEEIGIAGAKRKELLEAGYDDVTADDAPEGTYPDKIALYSNDRALGTKKLLEEKLGVDAHSYEELPADIPEDYDFVIILGGENKTETN